MHFVKLTLEENSVVRMINLCNVTNITYTTYEDGSGPTILINYVDGKSHIFSGRCAEAVYGALSEHISKENETRKILSHRESKF